MGFENNLCGLKLEVVTLRVENHVLTISNIGGLHCDDEFGRCSGVGLPVDPTGTGQRSTRFSHLVGYQSHISYTA